MIPVLFNAGTTDYSSNGLGRLPDCIRCEVEEERNGMYELELEYPVSGLHFSDLTEERIVLAVPSDGKQSQPFIIYRIDKPIDGVVTVYAHHISYMMEKITVLPYESNGGVSTALDDMTSHSVGGSPFVFWTDKSVFGSYKVNQPRTMRELLGGSEGSVLDVFGTGEWEFDRFDAKLWLHRGHDNGVTLRYGKNIIDMQHSVDASNVITGVVPFWIGQTEDSDDDVMVVGDPVYRHASDYSTSKTIPLDLSGEFENQPTKEQLENRAGRYMDENEPWDPDRNIVVDFLALADTEEYKDIAALERVSLCDTVSVINQVINTNDKLKVVRTKYDVLAERYTEIELGEKSVSLSSVIAKPINDEIAKKYAKTTEVSKRIVAAVEKASDLISGGTGGYVVISRNANGEPEEILIMDQPDTGTAINVIRINKNGIGFSNTGYGGPFTNAWTIDGTLNASFITAGELDGALIKAGSIIADALIRSNDPNTLWKTEIVDGTMRTYGIINGESHEVGRIAIARSETDADGEYPRYAINLDSHSKALGFYIRKNDTTDLNSYYFLNNGANPDGHEHRHIWYGTEYHGGSSNHYNVMTKKIGVSDDGNTYGTSKGLYVTNDGYINDLVTDHINASNQYGGQGSTDLGSITSGSQNNSWSPNVTYLDIEEAGVWYVECCVYWTAPSVITGNVQMRIVNANGSLLGLRWRDSRYVNSNSDVVCRVSGFISSKQRLNVQVCQNTGKALDAKVRWDWIRIK